MTENNTPGSPVLTYVLTVAVALLILSPLLSVFGPGGYAVGLGLIVCASVCRVQKPPK